MKPISKQSDKETAFTIIELLTVMSIIIILISLLVPSLSMVKRYAKEVKQKAQFHSIEAAIELFNGEWDGYPPSDGLGEDGEDYCGAMKLCEALVGQDLMGFHPSSHFLADCTDGSGNLLYDNPPGSTLYPDDETNLKAREGPYLQLENANAYRMWHLYGAGGLGSAFTGTNDQYLFVLCDVYNRVRNQETGKGIGMPILYYKADTTNTIHDPCGAPLPTISNNNRYIYNYWDNQELVELVVPGGTAHPLAAPVRFYEMTKDDKISITTGMARRADSYILISAGFDGLYGTEDDIFNF